ncbi:hypothetical protein MPH_06998 [Macrophomina phaseolina MS6]|uniref:Uncharacterized protein n=1 Tax=Macrophomina phaseolina (strain MS6) TaxID=1126212 RepID=K2SG36_MACPH|nr:hypothetical protein MPH_06998 [Macrophomina phaseolina MS6]
MENPTLTRPLFSPRPPPTGDGARYEVDFRSIAPESSHVCMQIWSVIRESKISDGPDSDRRINISRPYDKSKLTRSCNHLRMSTKKPLSDGIQRCTWTSVIRRGDDRQQGFTGLCVVSENHCRQHVGCTALQRNEACAKQLSHFASWRQRRGCEPSM